MCARLSVRPVSDPRSQTTAMAQSAVEGGSYMLNGLKITPQAPRFRSGRRNRAGYEEGAKDRDEEIKLDASANRSNDTIEAALLKKQRTQNDLDDDNNSTHIKTGNQLRPRQFQYRDHSADIQIHAWGSTFAEALEYSAIAMFHYACPLQNVDVDKQCTQTINVTATDESQLLIKFLDDLIYRELEVACCDVRVTDIDEQKWSLTAQVYGEEFSAKHERGTEIKAITYSAVDVQRTEGRVDIYFIVDI